MRIRLFFSALALTLLLLLPMVGLVEYFAMQRQMQERVRRANAAGALLSIGGGLAVYFSLMLTKTSLFGLHAVVPAFAAAAVLFWAGSIFGRPTPQHRLRAFFPSAPRRCE